MPTAIETNMMSSRQDKYINMTTQVSPQGVAIKYQRCFASSILRPSSAMLTEVVLLEFEMKLHEHEIVIQRTAPAFRMLSRSPRSKDENKKDETDCQQQTDYNERDECDAGHARQVPGKVHEIRYICAAAFDDLPDRGCKPDEVNLPS